MTPNDLMFREALIADHDDILNITKNEKLYYGRDYLPHILKEWLEQGVDKQSNRRNLVFLLENQIIGFRSLYFQNGGTVVVFYARRITKDIRGRGFGRKLSELSVQYAKHHFPLVTKTLASIGDFDFQDTEIADSKHGELLTKRTFVPYQVSFQEMANLLVKCVAALPEPTNENQFLTNDEFKEVLQHKAFLSAALENDTLNIQFQPILLKTKEDAEFASIGTHNVLLEGSMENPIAMSIFTHPFSIADGKARAMLDFYTCKPDDATRMSVVEHLTKHLVHFNQYNDAVEDRITSFEIFAFQDDIKRVIQDMEKAGLGERLSLFGTQKRVLQNVFVYKKDLQ